VYNILPNDRVIRSAVGRARRGAHEIPRCTDVVVNNAGIPAARAAPGRPALPAGLWGSARSAVDQHDPAHRAAGHALDAGEQFRLPCPAAAAVVAHALEDMLAGLAACGPAGSSGAAWLGTVVPAGEERTCGTGAGSSPVSAVAGECEFVNKCAMLSQWRRSASSLKRTGWAWSHISSWLSLWLSWRGSLVAGQAG
jgi:hypothetical protein